MFKSIKTGVLAIVLISTAIIVKAQQKINEGVITYTVEYNLTDDQQQLANMLPKETVIKFKDNLSKIEMEQGYAVIKIISDKSTKTGLLLVDVPIAQKQFAVKMSKDDIEKNKEGAPKLSDFKPTGEKQKIGNFNAEKYTCKDDKGVTYEVWASSEIELPEGYKEDEYKEVNGTLVKFPVFQNGIKSILTLKSIKAEQIPALSLEVPKGYEIKTMAEMKAMQQGGGR